jgi:GntR family transcriptional regulator/MocR family aminotransferase
MGTQLFIELLAIDRSSEVPVYLQITNAFIQNVLQGRFRKGLKLPGSREMAALLKINRMTVVAAYQELTAQGWVESISRKGVFVNVNSPTLSPKKITEKPTVFTLPDKPGYTYDVKRILPVNAGHFPSTGKLVLHDGGFPDVRLAPIEELGRRIRSLSRTAINKKRLMQSNAQGTLFFREILAAFLCDTRGLSITPENILITKGAQMGIYIASSILLKPGAEIIVGTPGYHGADETFKQAGAKLNYVPVGDEGIDVEEIEKICKKKEVRMVYVIPHHHHPTTSTLTPERRIRLLTLAAKFRFAIIEDDYDYDFHYAGKPMMPMASHDRNGNVIYVGTLTKSLSQAIRLGFIVAPIEFISMATRLRKSIDTHGDSLIENVVAELYKDGTISRHTRKSVKSYKDRRDHFCDLLKTELGQNVYFKIPEGGLSVWTKFVNHKLPYVAEQVFKKGLMMGNGLDYNTEKTNYNSVTLGFASLNFKEQENALAILKGVLKSL